MLGDFVASYAKNGTFRAFDVDIAKPSIGSTARLSICTENVKGRVHVRKNGEILLERRGLQL